MRTYLPGLDEEIKVFILEQFESEGSSLSVGDVFDRVSSKYDITSGRFFKIISELDKLRYISHTTEEKDGLIISVLRRL